MYTPNRFQKDKPQIIPIGLLVLSVLVAFFFTYDSFIEYQAKIEETQATQHESEEAGKLLEHLDGVKTQVTSGNSDIGKYIRPFREDVLYKQVFDLAQNSGQITNISLTQGEVLSTGLSLAGIQLQLQADSMENLLGFMDKVTHENSERRFLIKSVSFPYSSEQEGPISASILLGAYTIK